MSKLSKIFKQRKALITYITAGDPSLKETEKFIYQLEAAGADIIELGIPFSDPLADGPIICASHQRALVKDTSLAKVLQLVKKLKNVKVPLVLMLSDNLLVNYGMVKFIKDAKAAGLSGIIVPDLPPEEEKLAGYNKLRNNGIDTIFLVSPTSSEKRIKLIAKHSSGFVYLVSLTGITGTRNKLATDLSSLIKKVKKLTNKPVAVGFGIAKPEQAKQVAKEADGVIVGSALVKLIAANKKISSFVADLRKAINV